MPAELRDQVHVTGVELDPVTARIARLLQPQARILNADFARADLPASFDLAIGNPPFSDRIVRSDRAYRSMGLRLHDYFIARSIDLLKPGGLAAFVTSSGTMDKADCSAREHIARTADLVAAIRLPEGSFRADAGTDVVVDILFFRKRGTTRPRATCPGSTPTRSGPPMATMGRSASTAGSPGIRISRLEPTPRRRDRSARPIPACRVRALISRRRSRRRSPFFRKPSMTASPRRSIQRRRQRAC